MVRIFLCSNFTQKKYAFAHPHKRSSDLRLTTGVIDWNGEEIHTVEGVLWRT